MSSASIIVILITLLVLTQGRNGQFQLTPHNVTFYFDTSRYMQQLCIPPDIIPRPEVRWKKGNQTLTNGKRVLMLASEELKSFDTKVHVKNGSRVFLLSINPVGETDQGIYHCVFNSTNGEESASFSVKITDSCKPGTFKCRVDKKCILASALCDGVVHCSDSSDERNQCSPPLIPFGLRKHSKTWKQITIVWETVAGKITGYELLVIYPNNLNKTFIPSHPLVTIHGLAASTRYGFAVRSKSHAGYSEYSKIVYVSTRAHGLPKIPQGLRCTQKDVDFITIAWNNVKDASNYDLEMFTPDRNATEYFIAFRRLPQITVKGLTNNTLYRFKVRARSTFGTGNFSEAIVARTLPIGKPGAPTKIAAVVSGFDVSITWHHPNYRKNSQIFHLYYMITLCILEPVTAIVLVNKTVTVTVQPISFQQEGNSSVKVSAQQHITAGGVEKNNVTVQTRRELLMYKERECVKSKKLGYTRSIFTKLNPATTYRYTVTTFGRNDIKGGSVTGNFTIAMFTNSTSNSKNKTACEDHKECNYYWSRGWYTCAVGAVLYDYCPKSCGHCDKDPYPTPRPGELCKDYEPLCKNWAKYRECIYAQKFTEKYCPKSCGLCPEDQKIRRYNQFCVDSTYLCQSKAKSYGCLFQRKFMSKYCKKICKMCSSYSRCNDEDSLCNWWKQRGYCSLKKYKDHMKKNCRYSCGLCFEQQ